MIRLSEAIDSIKNKPNVRHIVNISGGKDSAALAIYLQQNFPQLPTEYVFCDTGCELPETYEYLEQLEGLLGKIIVKINAYKILNVRDKPGRTPFDICLYEIYNGFLPSARCRWCTRMLKIKPFEDYVSDSQVYSYIGIRNDEDREGYKMNKSPQISNKKDIIPVYPLKDEKITLSDVRSILTDSGIGLPKYYKWRSRSGCYFCFYQRIGEWQGLLENHPKEFQNAKKYEKDNFKWNEYKSLDEIEKLTEKYEVPSSDDVDGCAICHI